MSLIFMLFFSLIRVSWIHTKSKLINLYFKYEEFTVCQSYLNKLLKTKITFTNRFTAFLLCRALCWDTILGWNVFLWWMYTLGYQSPFLIFTFSHSKPYPHSTRHIYLSLNPENDSGIAIIWLPIFPRNWVFHSL